MRPFVVVPIPLVNNTVLLVVASEMDASLAPPLVKRSKRHRLGRLKVFEFPKGAFVSLADELFHHELHLRNGRFRVLVPRPNVCRPNEPSLHARELWGIRKPDVEDVGASVTKLSCLRVSCPSAVESLRQVR